MTVAIIGGGIAGLSLAIRADSGRVETLLSWPGLSGHPDHLCIPLPHALVLPRASGEAVQCGEAEP
jgi:hypothetical protein